MQHLQRLSRYVWLVVLSATFAYLAVVHARRMQQTRHLTGIAEWSCDPPAPDPTSATGRVGGTRMLVPAIDDPRSLEWIAEAQALLAGEPWRVRNNPNDNAPAGRPTAHTMPHRLWLAALGWIDHRLSDRPPGVAVEHVALYGDPLLHGLLVLGVVVFAAWRFGGLAACLLAPGTALWFPAAGQFVAGSPEAQGLAWGFALVSLLLVLAGIRVSGTVNAGPELEARGRPQVWFALSGFAGGFAAWADVATAVPVLGAMGVAAALAALVQPVLARPCDTPARQRPTSGWRWWGVAGGITIAAACLVEFGRDAFTWRVSHLHPVFALGWIALGELLERRARATTLRQAVNGWRAAATVLAAAGAVALAVARTVASGEDAPWLRDPLVGQLSRADAAGVEPNLAAWFSSHGSDVRLYASLMPLLIVVVVLTPVRQWRGSSPRLFAIVMLSGAALLLLVWACMQPRVMNGVGAVVVALLSAAVGFGWPGRARAIVLASLTVAAAVPGTITLWPEPSVGHQTALPEAQITRLFERDLAHWLRQRSGDSPVTVLAPPAASAALVYHGGMRGVCSLDPGNKDGFAAAVRIVAATTFEEARTLLEGRQITHLVFPSWDPTLDRYAGFGLGAEADSAALARAFAVKLRRGELPDWLRALPQQLPRIPGLAPHAVAVFEVVDEQPRAEALSRLAECYVELGEPARAIPLLEAMRHYPGDLGVRAAVVHVLAARGDRAALVAELDAIETLLASGADEYLPWDRRLSLAVVLAQAKRGEQARHQLERCFAEADASVLRAATPGELFKLLVLGRRMELQFADPRLDALSVGLLPPDFRRNL